MIIKSYETEKIKNINSKLILMYGENDGFKNDIFKDTSNNGYDTNNIVGRCDVRWRVCRPWRN